MRRCNHWQVSRRTAWCGSAVWIHVEALQALFLKWLPSQKNTVWMCGDEIFMLSTAYLTVFTTDKCSEEAYDDRDPAIMTVFCCDHMKWSLILFFKAGLLNVKRTVQAKNDKIKKNVFASNEVSTCSGCCGNSQLCDVCKDGLGGLNGTAIHQYLRNVCRKIALLKSFTSATSKEMISQFLSYMTDIGIKRRGILWSTKL